MAFDALSEKLQAIFKKLGGKGRLTEKDVNEAMREVKMALYEADVNFKIVKDFIKTVTEKAIGGNVLESINHSAQVIKIVNDELAALLGSSQSKLTFSTRPPTVYMIVGLNGAGKTSTSGKLGLSLRKQGRNPIIAACDVYRPAAIKQLQVLCASAGLPVFEMGDKKSPVEIAKKAVAHATDKHYDTVVLDTAGRLHVNDELMQELTDMKKQVKPQEIILVLDSLTGQDAVAVASSFNDRIGIDGVILTKLDSDTRGGAALSVRSVTGKPIKYIATGEKIADLEPFFPDRMASRILGMGDVVSLVEKAQQTFDEKQAIEMEQKLRKNEFTLEDFQSQMKQVLKMGSMKSLLGMIPGMNNAQIGDLDGIDTAYKGIEAIINSMTPQERKNPQILNSSRKKRVAKGSGTSIQQVNQLIKQFDEMKKMFRDLTGSGGAGGKRKGMGKFPFM
ncbi:MAG: signal recognition particle protein [Clostridiales bacterium]|jgi:signal recognition particle subunit SRP54|nr:signal recognition particle protein [Clostridiales bacterium]MDR2752453.1 signal recognition particle protein [Clostridiales bacterium]